MSISKLHIYRSIKEHEPTAQEQPQNSFCQLKDTKLVTCILKPFTQEQLHNTDFLHPIIS